MIQVLNDSGILFFEYWKKIRQEWLEKLRGCYRSPHALI